MKIQQSLDLFLLNELLVSGWYCGPAIQRSGVRALRTVEIKLGYSSCGNHCRDWTLVW